MDSIPRELVVVGDRVLITPEDGEEQRTRVGLYLPASAIDAQAVQTGLIVATGKGVPRPEASFLVVPQAAILVLVRDKIPLP